MSDTKKNVIKEIISYVLIIGGVLLIKAFVMSPIIVNGDSMNKTLKDNDIMILNKWSYHFDEVERFDIVVVKDEDGYLIKRVIGLPGDIIYKDVNGDGIINSMDERPIGYPDSWAPMLSFGGNIGLIWKDFDLNMDFAGASMQSWFQNYELRNPFHAGGTSPAYLLEDRWHRADVYDPNSEWIPGKYPAIRRGTSVNNGRNSDFWQHDVRYLRLKNLEFGYSIPSSMLDKINLSKVRVYISASNLLTFDNVSEYQIDPEIQAQAAVVYPQQKTILIGFNLTF